jgi:hypothetical protein
METRIIRDLIVEVLTTARLDDTGVTYDLVEPALRAAAEIGMTSEEIKALAEEQDEV